MIRIAALGCQHQHVFHMIARLLAGGRAQLVGLAEPEPAYRAVAEARLPGVPSYADPAELLGRERPQVAVLAPRSSDKAALIELCLAAGVHAYVDKPMAVSHEGLARIRAAAAASPAHLYMAASGGYGLSAAVRRLVEAGELGRLVQYTQLAPHRLRLRPEGGWTRPTWSYQREHNGGVIVDLAIHGINNWRFVSGQEVAEVAAVHGNRRFPEHPQLEDHATVLLTMADGSTAVLQPSWLTPDADPSHGRGATFLVGTEGQLEITSAGIAHGLTGAAEHEEVVLTTATRAPHRPELDDPLSPEEDFLRAVETGGRTRVTADFLIESSRIALLARDAADQGRPVRAD